MNVKEEINKIWTVLYVISFVLGVITGILFL